MNSDVAEHLHAYARQCVEDMKASGGRFDRKTLRFNDIVAVGDHYARCGTTWSMDSARAGVREAVLACRVDLPADYLPAGPRAMIQRWMEAAE